MVWSQENDFIFRQLNGPKAESGYTYTKYMHASTIFKIARVASLNVWSCNGIFHYVKTIIEKQISQNRQYSLGGWVIKSFVLDVTLFIKTERNGSINWRVINFFAQLSLDQLYHSMIN